MTNATTTRTLVDSLFLADRETQVMMFADLGDGSSIVFTFEGGLHGSHTITELSHDAKAWDRARAHWTGYVAANNDTLARRGAVAAPVADAPMVRARCVERTPIRFYYRLVSRNSHDLDNQRIRDVDAVNKTEARKLIAAEYRNEVPPARYGFVAFSACRIVWLDDRG